MLFEIVWQRRRKGDQIRVQQRDPNLDSVRHRHAVRVVEIVVCEEIATLERKHPVETRGPFRQVIDS